jgi:hypothetical protein
MSSEADALGFSALSLAMIEARNLGKLRVREPERLRDLERILRDFLEAERERDLEALRDFLEAERERDLDLRILRTLEAARFIERERLRDLERDLEALRIFFALEAARFLEAERERDLEALRDFLEAERERDLEALRALVVLDTLRTAFIIFAILEAERERLRDLEALRLGDLEADFFITFLPADLLRDAERERERDLERPRAIFFNYDLKKIKKFFKLIFFVIFDLVILKNFHLKRKCYTWVKKVVYRYIIFLNYIFQKLFLFFNNFNFIFFFVQHFF